MERHIDAAVFSSKGFLPAVAKKAYRSLPPHPLPLLYDTVDLPRNETTLLFMFLFDATILK